MEKTQDKREREREREKKERERERERRRHRDTENLKTPCLRVSVVRKLKGSYVRPAK